MPGDGFRHPKRKQSVRDILVPVRYLAHQVPMEASVSEIASEEKQQKSKQTKRERFIRVAQRRTKKLLREIQLLARCSNRSSYEYSEKDVLKIFEAIQTELNYARSRFMRNREISFSLTEEEENDLKR